MKEQRPDTHCNRNRRLHACTPARLHACVHTTSREPHAHTLTRTTPTLHAMDSSFAQRRQEIEAKKAKLAELKRQRELRREQAGSGRQSSTASPLGEVRWSFVCLPSRGPPLTCSAGAVAHTTPEPGSRPQSRRRQPHQQHPRRPPPRINTTGLASSARNTPHLCGQRKPVEQRQ